MLEDKGYPSDKAVSGRDAIKLIEARKISMVSEGAQMYSLIICDYSMPEMDGPQVARAIRSMLEGISQPLICCCTAYSEATFKESAYRAGMD